MFMICQNNGNATLDFHLFWLCWVATKPLSESFKENFVKALSHGIDNLDLAIEKMGSHYPNSINQKRYLGEVISYQLDASKEISLQRFLAALA